MAPKDMFDACYMVKCHKYIGHDEGTLVGLNARRREAVV